MAQIIVQYGRPSRSSWAKSIWSSFSRIVMGQAIWETSIEVRLGRRFPIGNVYSYTMKRVILICVCGWHQIGWKENKHWSDVGNTKQRSWFGTTHILLRSCTFGMHSKTMWKNKDIVDNYRTMFESRIYAGGTKNIMFGKSMYFFVVLRHGGSCQEMCGTKLWVGEQNDSTTLQRIHSMHRWPPFQRRRIEIRWRIVKIMFSNCSEMLIFDTYWTIWYSLVREQACAIDLEMDQSLWQTIISFDLLQSSYMWI